MIELLKTKISNNLTYNVNRLTIFNFLIMINLLVNSACKDDTFNIKPYTNIKLHGLFAMNPSSHQ